METLQRKLKKKLLQNDRDSISMDVFKHLTMKNQSISSIQNSGRSHKSISKTQEHETRQGKWITRSKGGSQKFSEFWENVAGATEGLMVPIITNLSCSCVRDSMNSASLGIFQARAVNLVQWKVETNTN